MNKEVIGFGGGCHWCTEAVFQALRGVHKVEQGWIKSQEPHDNFSEAVLVHFDTSIISYAVLIEIHARTHASRSHHSMRKKYRSAIYVFDERQTVMSENILRDLQTQFEDPLIVQVLKFIEFKPSDERYQDYYLKNAGGPFCKNYIDPKLTLLRKEYGDHLS